MKKFESVTIEKKSGKVISTKEKEEDSIVDENVLDRELNDDFVLEPENNPHIDDFTPSVEGGTPPVTSIQIAEEDRLKIVVAQLQLENFELQSKIIEQKHSRKIDEINRLIADYKVRYKVPEEWVLNAPTGTFNKKR